MITSKTATDYNPITTKPTIINGQMLAYAQPPHIVTQLNHPSNTRKSLPHLLQNRCSLVILLPHLGQKFLILLSFTSCC